MKKVLLISPYPYTKTSRGMDVLTECFEESGITPDRIVAGPFVDGPMCVWLGETEEENEKINWE